MSQLEALLNAARSQIGVKESPANSNKVKYNTWYYGKEVSGDKYAWCSVFVLWCFNQAGIGELAFGGTLAAIRNTKMWPEGARVWKTLAVSKGQWTTSAYAPGDVVVFDWDKNGAIDHVGIVEAVSADGKTLTTIEGNTSAGSNSNGGEVQRRTRAVNAAVVGAYRPKYDAGAGNLAGGLFSNKIQAGAFVTIKPGAKYGGTAPDAKGKDVPPDVSAKKWRVSSVVTQNGREEALLDGLWRYVAVSDLNLL